jgi:hypothetical protein
MTLVSSMPKASVIGEVRQAAPIFSAIAIAFIIAFALCTALGFFDARMLNGVSVWEKPAKFFLSLSLHAATLGWGMTLLPETLRGAKGIRRATFAFGFAAIAEMTWITLQGARAAASHFNTADPVAMALYPLMGLGAVTLTIVTVYLGWRILRSGEGTVAYAAGIGFMISGILTTVVAGYMSQRSGHSVGGDVTDATGLTFFHWSTTGGDLRVPHFAALHIAQALPMLAWVWADRRGVTVGAVTAVVIVGALFAQALAGVPFLRG